MLADKDFLCRRGHNGTIAVNTWRSCRSSIRELDIIAYQQCCNDQLIHSTSVPPSRTSKPSISPYYIASFDPCKVIFGWLGYTASFLGMAVETATIKSIRTIIEGGISRHGSSRHVDIKPGWEGSDAV